MSIILVDKVDNTRSVDERGFERSEEMKDVAVDRTVVHGVGAESEGTGESLPYSWMSDYFPRLDGKVARREYYARLERSSKHSLDGTAVF